MGQALNILHITPYYAPAYAFGGVVRAVDGLARAQAAAGHRVTVVTTDACTPASRVDGASDEAMSGVRVLRARNQWLRPRARFNLSTPRGWPALLDHALLGVEVVHVHEFRTAELLLGAGPIQRANAAAVLSPHGTLDRTTGRGAAKIAWDALFSRRLARVFDAVIALTDQEGADVAALWERLGVPLPASGVPAIPNGVDAGFAAALPPRAGARAHFSLGDGPVVLYLGRLHPRKGAHLLAAAFVASAPADARLLVVGPDEGLAAAIAAHGDARIHLTGYLDGEDRLAALAAADVFALPAVGEGLSIAALEAMAAGLPVILSPGCYLPEVVPAGAGLVVAPEVGALAGALDALLAAPERRAAMGAAARVLVAGRYTWDRVAGAMADAYVAAIAARARS
jgi:glycosyltransferase involved in cell wall biosynthesis